MRAVFFAWSAALGKILVDNLRKRYIIVVDCSCMCKRSRGSMGHFLLNCEIASMLWDAILSHVELAWFMLI